MSHVAAHRWGDLAAGRLGAAEVRRLERHAAQCPRCARARDRVVAARAAMTDIARSPAPEVGWDHIRARVYWAVSSEKKAQERRSIGRSWRWWLAAPVALTAATAMALTIGAGEGRPIPLPSSDHGAHAAVAATPVELVPAALTGVVTLVAGGGFIDGEASGAVLDHAVVAGSRLRTTDGRIAVQFGADSAFVLGASSTMDVRRFDSAAVELVVNGEISVEVTKRAPGQRFAVIAGDRTIEVRGTAFRVVHRERALEVACSHGRVAVSDGQGEVLVGAGAALALADAEPLLGRHAEPMAGAALAALIAAQGPRLPAWTDPVGLYRTSGPLQVAATRGRGVRVDGVEVGRGAMTLRMMSGRHLVEAERASGGWGRGEWIEVAGGDGARVDIDSIAAAPPAIDHGGALEERRAQLEAALDHGRAAACLRALTKQGITDTFVELEIGVDATGAVGFLNIVDTDLPRSTASCVRDAVAAVHFPHGAEATWRHRLTF